MFFANGPKILPIENGFQNFKHQTAYPNTHQPEMDSKTVQFVVNTLAAHFNFDADEAGRIVMTANSRDTPAYQKAMAAHDATKAKIEEMKTKIAAGKPRKGSDLPAKLAELEKKLEEQKARADEIAANAGTKKKRAPKAAEAAGEPAAEPEPETEAPAPAAPAPKAKKVKADAAEKRIKRMSPALVKQLTNVFDETKTAMTKDHPAEFAKYINELVKEDFDEKSLTDHMRTYVATIAGGGIPKDAPDADEIPDATVDQLAVLKARLVEAYGPGVYWNPDTKTFIKGPKADEDEDVTETNMDGITYAVGDKTRRVYREIDGVDVFEGFLGIGKFATMTI